MHDRPSRPDKSAKLKAAHEAAAHDLWFREQVEIGLNDMREGRVYDTDEVFAEFLEGQPVGD